MSIHVHGASEHNLQDIDVEFGDELTVVTGVSGSGKTTLVFDVLYHEARRRFLEVYSLGSSALRLSPARVRAIDGLGPAIAVGQNLLNRNPASTLATASGLHPFLRLLYANLGERHCSQCGAGLTLLSDDEIVERLMELARPAPVEVHAPLVQGARGSHHALLQFLSSEFGIGQVVVDEQPWAGEDLDASEAHTIEVQIAELEGGEPATRARAILETAAALGAMAVVVRQPKGQALRLARAPVCAGCGAWFGELRPVHFHTPCPECGGSGCAHCAQTGLHPEAAAVRWGGMNLPQLLAGSVDATYQLFREAEMPSSAARLRWEIERRLGTLIEVGLGYISLDRPSPTLSRGEAQRVRLAVALTSRLEDMLHVLDEPTIGQHPADVARLLPTFRKLAGPVIYVEHDRVAAAAADQAVDLGPGAGAQGGRVLFSGTPAELWRQDSATGRYFSLRERVVLPQARPEASRYLTLRGAHLRNLQHIDVLIPIGRLTVITGVSGSGKSTLVEDVLVASLAARKPVGCEKIYGPWLKPVWVNQDPIGINPRSVPATYTNLADMIRDLYAAATGLSPSHFSFNRQEGACPTCKGMGAVEVHMKYLPTSWAPCPDCDGQRYNDEVLAARVTMGGLSLSIADMYALTVAEAMPLLLQSGRLPIADQGAAEQILQALCDVGLGYLSLGQPSPTLSGGEAQRVKLAKYLGKRKLSGQLLVLDEPSTGLHPQDVAGLLIVLDRLVRSGATVVVVEHNTDIIRAADWCIDLGPGAGPQGGRLLHAGPPETLPDAPESLTGQVLRTEAELHPREQGQPRPSPDRATPWISIRGARANNLCDVDVDVPKRTLTVVTGVSGSGKSSLVSDVLETEARRRFLESLSLYERQSTHEGPEAPVGSVSGLGVALAVGSERRLHERRATVGTASELTHHLAALLAAIGERRCLVCGGMMQRQQAWHCPSCGADAAFAEPRHFFSSTYAAACLECHGVGSMQAPRPEKLIIHPEKPLCDGAMYSPGFFPNGYLCKPYNGGYDMVQALAQRYGFDPATTPWEQMAPEAQQAFLFGDPNSMTVHYVSRTGRTHTSEQRFPGFYGWIRDWDVGGTYTETQPCPTCHGARLRPEYLAVRLGGHNIQALSEMSLTKLAGVVLALSSAEGYPDAARTALQTVKLRLRFLQQVGLGYLHLGRPAATLSAGEAQRIRLAGLLGSGLTSLTILLDEPTRGLHPSEVQALLDALVELRDEGNTVIVVEHDPLVMRRADHLVDMGPGAGAAGGHVVAQGKPEDVERCDTITGAWLRGERQIDLYRPRREGHGWLIVRGARGNNLRGEDARLPLGAMVGICGVSGSGKSTLVIDTLGRALAPRKYTTSMASEPIDPAPYDAIEGAPARSLVVDQSRAGVVSPASFLALERPLRLLYADSEDAHALGLDEGRLGRQCSVCGGSGSITLDMGFLPDVHVPCESCRGSGYLPEAWDVCLRGKALPELMALTIEEVQRLWQDCDSITHPLTRAIEAGLGYLVLRQPGYTLSGGEVQRLKIVKELGHKASQGTLYILDEPTVGQHLDDVARLTGVLHRRVDDGHTVLVVEHHPHLLATCDWLVELGPGGGPEGGHIVAAGTPETVAAGNTPTAHYLREILEAKR